MGATPKWMVFVRDNPIKMDDVGVPPIHGTPQMIPVDHPLTPHFAKDGLLTPSARLGW